MKRYILLLIILYQVSLAPEERKFHKNDITLGLVTVPVENNVGIGGFSDRQYILNSGIEAGLFLSESVQLAGRFFVPYKADSTERAGYSLEPYTLKKNMGEMSEAILRYYFQIRKKSEENKTFSILPYLGVSAGYLNSIEYKFLRNLPDGTVVTNSCFFCSPNSSLLELFGPIADSYTVFIPKRNFIGINAGITFLFESFFWGIEFSSNSHQKKDAEVLYNSEYLHYSKAVPVSPQELFYKQFLLKERTNSDTGSSRGRISMIYFSAGARF